MPIKPENKHLYPDNWKDISTDIRTNRAKNRCEVCGIKNHLVIMRLPHGKYRTATPFDWDIIHSRIRNCHTSMAESLKFHGFIRIVLTVAHLDHNPQNCDYSNLKAMCQKCHNNYDQHHRRNKISSNQLKMNL